MHIHSRPREAKERSVARKVCVSFGGQSTWSTRSGAGRGGLRRDRGRAGAEFRARVGQSSVARFRLEMWNVVHGSAQRHVSDPAALFNDRKERNGLILLGTPKERESIRWGRDCQARAAARHRPLPAGSRRGGYSGLCAAAMPLLPISALRKLVGYPDPPCRVLVMGLHASGKTNLRKATKKH